MWVVLLLLVFVFGILITIGYIGEMRKGSTQAASTHSVFGAWMSGDLDQMLRALNIQTHKIDRHFLL